MKIELLDTRNILEIQEIIQILSKHPRLEEMFNHILINHDRYINSYKHI